MCNPRIIHPLSQYGVWSLDCQSQFLGSTLASTNVTVTVCLASFPELDCVCIDTDRENPQGKEHFALEMANHLSKY